MYSTIYSMLRRFYPGGFETHRYLKELEKTQWFSPQELEAWQFPRIQQVVKYAYEKVPYYNKLFRRLDIHPQDIKSLKDFQNLPFLTREDVNNHLDELVSPEWRDKVKMDSTSGSTGQPLRFYLDQSWHWWDAALEFRGRGWYGVGEGDKIAWFWGALRDISEQGFKPRLKAKILRNRYLNAFIMTEATMKAFAEMLIKWKPDMFRAYASALSLFAEFVKERRIEGIHPKLIETTGEKLTESQRELLEGVFQCKAADWYSAREFGTIAFPCPEGGVHVCETRYLEIIADGRAAEAGQMGEVAITSLHQFAMPFIRYKIGDMAVCEPKTCSCGRGLPVIKEIVGRTDDFLVTTDGKFISAALFEYIFMERPEVFRYQVYQPDKSHLEIRVVCNRQVDSSWIQNVHDEIQARIDSEMKISLQVVDEIELTLAGKHRSVLSKVKQSFT